MKSYRFMFCIVFVSCCSIDISNIAASPVVLTDTTTSYYVSAGNPVLLYGTDEDNDITIESGAKVKIIHFPGNNIIEFETDVDLFTVSRSGAIITFSATDGTVLRMPATRSVQKIIFSDNVTLNLVIDNHQMMLGSQIITLDESAIDYEEETAETSEGTQINLLGSTASISGSGATVEDSTITISSSGTYTISGTLADGQIIIDSEDEDEVILILNGIDISSSTSAPLFIKESELTTIVLAAGSENYMTDSDVYIFDDPEEDEPDATLFSKDDLVIEGSGTLTIEANYNNAVKSKDGLDITGGTLQITSVDDGIIGKDYLNIENGTFTINAQGDGMKSTEDEETDKGYVTIDNGTFNITSGADAIQAATNITINEGNFYLLTGGGSSAVSELTEDDSAKGVKGCVAVTISGGTFSIDAADDAIHSNGTIDVDGGIFSIATGDDGFHADADLTVNSGFIDITTSYEGMEGSTIIINGGDMYIVASDDGFNAAGGSDDDIMAVPDDGTQLPGGGHTFPPGDDMLTDSGDYHLYINDGTIVIYAEGDGLDSNGTFEINGGVVIVHGPTNSADAPPDGALDSTGSFVINGGLLIAAGSSDMAQAPGLDSTQNCVSINFNSSLSAGTLIDIQDSDGNDILTFKPSKTYQSIVYSSPDLMTGETYDVYLGGSATGTPSDGLYEQDALYSPGTQYTEFSISSTVTTVGDGGGSRH